jgi:hypothetical protein
MDEPTTPQRRYKDALSALLFGPALFAAWVYFGAPRTLVLLVFAGLAAALVGVVVELIRVAASQPVVWTIGICSAFAIGIGYALRVAPHSPLGKQ